MELRIMFTYGDGEERSVVSGLRRKESERERERETGDWLILTASWHNWRHRRSIWTSASRGRTTDEWIECDGTSCSASVSIANGFGDFFQIFYQVFSVAIVRKIRPKESTDCKLLTSSMLCKLSNFGVFSGVHPCGLAGIAAGCNFVSTSLTRSQVLFSLFSLALSFVV